MRFPWSTQPYFKIVGWGWYYLLTVLDDYSRFIIDWKLFRSMTTNDVTDLLDSAIEKTGVDGRRRQTPAATTVGQRAVFHLQGSCGSTWRSGSSSTRGAGRTTRRRRGRSSGITAR